MLPIRGHSQDNHLSASRALFVRERCRQIIALSSVTHVSDHRAYSYGMATPAERLPLTKSLRLGML